MRITDEMEASLSDLSAAIEEGSNARIIHLAEQFQSQWQENEKLLLRYIHHEALDAIDSTTARLPALARYEDYGELAAEVARLQELIDHVYDSEVPNFRNIF